MKRVFFTALSTLIVISAIAPMAPAFGISTSTCPNGPGRGNHCVGAGH